MNSNNNLTLSKENKAVMSYAKQKQKTARAEYAKVISLQTTQCVKPKTNLMDKIDPIYVQNSQVKVT